MVYTIAQLQERWNLHSRQAVYNRFAHLEAFGLERSLEEGSAFMREMDNLNLYLQQPGAQMAGYTPSSQAARVQVVGNPVDNRHHGNGQSSEAVDISLDVAQSPPWLLFAEAIAQRLSPSSPDPLLPQRQLQELADRGWLATTSQLRAILGVHPREGVWYGFHLSKAGRIGRQGAWEVRKPS